MNIRALIAEFLGVFALCFVGIGAIAATQGSDLMAIALAHGLAIGLLVVALGAISGGHFNPAVIKTRHGFGPAFAVAAGGPSSPTCSRHSRSRGHKRQVLSWAWRVFRLMGRYCVLSTDLGVRIR